MLQRVADGVWVHTSEFLQTNTVVVRGAAGVLVIDAGVQEQELTCLAGDLADAGQTVVAGFSTHPHWDHLLWHAALGEVPRWATATAEASARARLSAPDAKARIAEHLESTGIADTVPLDLLGLVTALPAGAATVPWDGPAVRVVEHAAHAPGHAALVVEELGVLVAGDTLSDILIPMLDLNGTADPIGDYLAALDLLAAVGATVAVPGHGSVATGGEVGARIALDRAYVLGLGGGGTVDDPRIGESAKPGWEWVTGIHDGQAETLAARSA